MQAVLAISLVSSLAFAQEFARIEGVVRSATGEAVPGATVGLGNPGRPGVALTAVTGGDGKFIIDGIAPAVGYQLSAIRPGYVRGVYGSRTPGGRPVSLTLAAGQVLKDVVITMMPQGVIGGRVTDAAGDPIPAADVILWQMAFSGARRELTWVANTATDDRGDYRIAGVAPGRYYVSAGERRAAAGQSGAPGDPQPQWRSVATFYPNAAEVAGAAAVDVQAGAVREGIDIRLARAPTYTLRGTTVDAVTGAPLSGTVLEAIRESGSSSLSLISRAETRSGSDGSFELSGLVRGAYRLQATLARAGATSLSARAEVTVSTENINGVVVPLKAAGVLTGSVRLEGGDIQRLIPEGSPTVLDRSTPQGTDAYLRARLLSDQGLPVTGFRPFIELRSAEPGLPSPTEIGVLQDDGTFRIGDVPAGRYFVALGALPEGVYLKSLRSGGMDVLLEPVDLTEGSATLDVVLSEKGAEVAAVVRNDRGEVLPAAPVTLWPKKAELGRLAAGIRYLFTDDKGLVRFRGVAPGDYYVAAWEDVEPGILRNYAFVSLFHSRAAEVRLSEGSQATVNPPVIPATAVEREIARLP